LGPRILVVQNADWEGAGLIGTAARAANVSQSTSRLFRKSRGSHAIPFEKLERGFYAAVVSLGSPSTAYLPETNSHHGDLVELFKVTRRRRIPSFNVCYSMQLFSVVHGGRVVKNPAGKEVGFFDVYLTKEGESDKVFGPLGAHSTLQWHEDIVDELPLGAVRIGFSKKTKNQIAVVDGIHYLVQGDGQAATPAMVKNWMKHDEKWALQRTSLDKDDLIRKAVEKEKYFRSTYIRAFNNFLTLATSLSDPA
jgi:GMP synthase-like glutamine amidotransferase